MSHLDYESARYRVAFAYGVAMDSHTGPDRELTDAFEQFLQRLTASIGPIDLVQKGLAYFDGLKIETLRQVKRTKGRDLTSYADATKDAQQAGLYVFDVMSASTPPTFLANVHWSRSQKLGSVQVAAVSGREIGRFVSVAVEERRLASEAVLAFDEAFAQLFDSIGGVKGGVLAHRPYIWNGRAGLDWMFRELTQSARGDLERWQLAVDKEFVAS